MRHATHAPTPDETSQRGNDAGQWLTSVAVHAAQAPEDRQIGVAALHSASAVQARHARLVPSQTGRIPLHSALPRQPTQRPARVSHTGVAPVQRVPLLAEHWPHAPVAWQAGNIPPQSSSAPQPRQAWKIGSHTGVAPPHALASRHCTQIPIGV